MISKETKNDQQNHGAWECTLAELKVGMKGLSVTGNPAIIDSPYGKAVLFDGINDGFFLAENPLKGLSGFTAEAIIRPDINGPFEQRFLHIGEIDGDRLLLETRLTSDNVWYLDTFILSGQSKNALIEPRLVHPAGLWYHMALTLDIDGQMTNYINGKMEIKGQVAYKSIDSGEMSIGARRNKVSWFKGAIYKVRISPGVLKPEAFMTF